MIKQLILLITFYIFYKNNIKTFLLLFINNCFKNTCYHDQKNMYSNILILEKSNKNPKFWTILINLSFLISHLFPRSLIFVILGTIIESSN